MGVYIHVCVCMCECVSERERERKRENLFLMRLALLPKRMVETVSDSFVRAGEQLMMSAVRQFPPCVYECGYDLMCVYIPPCVYVFV